MRRVRFLAMLATGAAAGAMLLASCGGGDGDQAPRVHYTSMVVFGDSLSDMGSYATPTLVGATHTDGRYTLNSGDGSTKIWVDHIAEQVRVTVPCAARTGLQSRDALAAFAAAPVDHAGCTAYAQGGARVTNPVGPGNTNIPGAAGSLGQLTDPVLDQMNRHLTNVGGAYSGTELVTVFAGGNDMIINLAAVQAADPNDPVAQQAAAVAAATAMATAGGELAAYIRGLVVARGAQHVVVINLPDFSLTPGVQLISDANQRAATIGLVQQLGGLFNQQLSAGLAGVTQVVFVDAFTAGRDQAARPAQYGLTDVTHPACDLAAVLIPTALVCTTTSLAAGADDHFQYTDTVHPTPYAHLLIAQLVAQRLIETGHL